jgi:hypothetical protein
VSGLGVAFDGIPIVPHRLEDVSKMPNLTQAPGLPSDQLEVDAVCEDTVKALLVAMIVKAELFDLRQTFHR